MHKSKQKMTKKSTFFGPPESTDQHGRYPVKKGIDGFYAYAILYTET